MNTRSDGAGKKMFDEFRRESEEYVAKLKRAVNVKTARGSRIREDIGDFVIEEQSVTGDTYGEYRFALDRRVRQPDGTVRLVNVGWYKTYRGAMNALSMERSAHG